MDIHHQWLLFLPQLPATPSSLRVLVWRRLRAAGAVGLQHGVWVLPHTAVGLATCQALLDEMTRQGGSGTIFVAQPLDAAVHADIVARSRADRDHEYTEFGTQAKVLLAEVAQETAHAKFTFAELEEIEHDLAKLDTWLHTIQIRDFFHGTQAAAATTALAACRHAVQAFAQAVYAREGVLPSTAGTDDSAPTTHDVQHQDT
jgi:hypothetical protein